MYPAKEAAEITGLSTAALRYYEKENLCPFLCGGFQKMKAAVLFFAQRMLRLR